MNDNTHAATFVSRPAPSVSADIGSAMEPRIVGRFQFKPAEIGVFNGDAADSALAGFEQGCHLLGMTMGQFSLIDMIHSLLKKTGPADVYIATWSAGIKDAHQVRWLMDTQLIRGIRLLTDHSYVNRQKRYAASIEELFGRENIRTSEMHAKFVLIGNEDYQVALVSSMNLNANRTCETFMVYESAEIFQFYRGFIEHHFDGMADGWESSSRRVSECVSRWFAKHDGAPPERKGRHWSES
jgi:hypothetical protein